MTTHAHEIGTTVEPRVESERRAAGWSPARVAAGVVLSAWAFLFWFLLGTGRWALFLSTRNEWVIPVGGALLSAAAIGRLASARTERPEPLARKQAWTLGFICMPVVVTLALPPATLGNYAVSRRGNFVQAGFTASSSDISKGQLTLLDVAGAQTSKEGQRALASRAGSQVSFVGFVSRDPGTAADEFLLTRFVVTCCVADALPAQVRVVNAPPGRFADDDWVQVNGTIYPLGREVLVDATTIRPVAKPNPPYITP